MPARQAAAYAPRRQAMADVPMPRTRRAIRLASVSRRDTRAAEPAPIAETPAPSEPKHAGADWREHDLMIRRFHNAGLTPMEIAVVLDSKGLRVRTWHVSETFVRNRLKALDMAPNQSRVWYGQHENCYRRRVAE